MSCIRKCVIMRSTFFLHYASTQIHRIWSINNYCFNTLLHLKRLCQHEKERCHHVKRSVDITALLIISHSRKSAEIRKTSIKMEGKNPTNATKTKTIKRENKSEANKKSTAVCVLETKTVAARIYHRPTQAKWNQWNCHFLWRYHYAHTVYIVLVQHL